LENAAKHILTIKDTSYNEIMAFLEAADVYGKNITAIKDDPLSTKNKKNTISYEARRVKKLLIQVRC
jgi:tetratricopeptide repeat protein 30